VPATPDQLLDQSVRHAVFLERYKSGAFNDHLVLLEEMEQAILKELSGDITQWNRTRLNKQLRAISKATRKSTDKIEALAMTQLIDLADYEAGFEVRSLSKVVTGVDFDLPSENQVIARVNGSIRLGFGRGETTQQIIKSMSDIVGVSSDDLDLMVRTGLAHSAQIARNEVWKKNDEVVTGVRITATLDSGTTAICRSEDGKIYPMGKGPRPPFHLRCRTTTTGALHKRYEFLGKGATRTSKDPITGDLKKVPATETYYSWLKRQPASVQNSIIGKSRGKLLRNGGLSVERFAKLQLDDNLKPITLKKMKELEPVAFEKANVKVK